ncbi:MAG: KGK domain-containing protein [Okeania sp. SIO2H7]|nr:KGK domain-containing protein [Okeania sp. SIO2H7]
MSEEFTPLDESEVVQIPENLGNELNLSSNSFKSFPLTGEQLSNAIQRHLKISPGIKNQLFNEGLDCEVLKFAAKGWQKGKIRVKMTVEFCPDEPEEPETPEQSKAGKSDPDSLDDLRRELNQ